MKTRIKFATTVWMIALLSSFGGWNIAAAQDTATPTPEPTAEVTSVVVVPPEATAEPAPVEPEPEPDTSVSVISLILDKAGDFAMLIAIVVLAFKTGSLIPADTVDKALERGFSFAKSIAATTETTIDDSFLNVSEETLRKFVREEIAKRDIAAGAAYELSSNHREPVGN